MLTLPMPFGAFQPPRPDSRICCDTHLIPRILKRLFHLFTALVFRLVGWLSEMEVLDESSIEKTYPTGSAVVRGGGGRAVLDCSKVNRVGEADVEAPKKLHRSIRNTLWGDPRVDDRTDHSTANLEIRARANTWGNKADAEGGVRRDATVCGWAIENTAINSRCQAAVDREVIKSPATETRCVGIEAEGAALVGEPITAQRHHAVSRNLCFGGGCEQGQQSNSKRETNRYGRVKRATE